MSAPSRSFGPETVQRHRRMRFNPIRTLTPESLATTLDQFETGWLAPFALLFDAMRRRDDLLGPCLLKREKAVARRSWSILVNENLEERERAEAERHRDALHFFFDQLTVTDALDQNQRGGASLLFRQMMRAVSERYAVHEIVWEPRLDPATGAARLTATLTRVPLWFCENTTGRLRFVAEGVMGVEGKPMAENEWLVTVGDGVGMALAVAYTYKRLSLQDWIAFNEKFGMPGLHAKTDAAKDSTEWDVLVEAVQDFANEFACVTNRDAEIALIEAKGGGSALPFGPLVERMDRAIAAICRGADLSTISAGAGEGTGASLQGDESVLLEEDDAQTITEALEPLCQTIIAQLFGTDTPLAYLQITVPQPRTTDDTIKKIDALNKWGIPVARDYAQQELDVPPAPEDAEPDDLIKPPPAAPALSDGPPVSPFYRPTALANVATSPQRSQADAPKFRRAAIELLSAAREHDLAPVIMRVEAALRLPDDRVRDALLSIQADLPRLTREIFARRDQAEALEQIMATALVAGASEQRAESR